MVDLPLRAALWAAALLPLAACSKAPAPAPQEAGPAEAKVDGEIRLTADAFNRLGLKVVPAVAATDAPLAVLPAVIAPPPNARVAVAATFPGVVTRILVVEGEAVRKGQALAVIASRDILSMGADLARADARLGVAKSNDNRVSQLYREGIVAGARADEARAALSEARADASEKNRILHMVNGAARSGTYTLTAPIAGRVTSAAIQAGSVLDGSTAPYVIDADGSYEAQAQLPDRLAGSVKPGMAAVLGDIRGTVTAVGSTIDPATRSVTVKARLPIGASTLAGRATSLSIFGPAPEGAVMVPEAAVTDLGDGPGVFVRSRQGVRIRLVKTGGKDKGQILILSGLKPGEPVVVEGTSSLKPMAMGE